MNCPTRESTPNLRPGCRLHNHPSMGKVLLVPEGIIRLNETGARVLEYCDGTKPFAQVVSLLRRQYPAKTTEDIESEIGTFLERLRLKCIVNY